MANVNAPRGLIPVADFSGAPYSGSINQYYHAAGDSQAIYIGDLVTATGTSTFVNMGGGVQSLANVAQSVTGGVFQGVCVGVLPDPNLTSPRDSAIFARASTGCIVLVADDPDILCIAQDVNSGTPLTANDIQFNVNVLVNQVSTVTGMSGMVLDNTTEAGTNTLDLKIVGQYLVPNNELGTAVGTGAAAGQWLVKLNRHRYVTLQNAGV